MPAFDLCGASQFMIRGPYRRRFLNSQLARGAASSSLDSNPREGMLLS
jgi:hypothetical protein